MSNPNAEVESTPPVTASIKVYVETHRKLRIYSAATGRSIASILADASERYMREHPPDLPQWGKERGA